LAQAYRPPSPPRLAAMPINLFGKKEQTAQEKAESAKTMVREWNRKIKGEQRAIERQIGRIDMEERKVQTEIKKLAAKGQLSSAKILAQEVVRTRKTKERMIMTKVRLSGVSMELEAQVATMKMASCISTSNEVMQKMSELINVREVQQTMQTMAKEMARAGLIQETLDDAMDAALGEEDEEQAADEEVNKVLEELAIDIDAQIAKPGQAPLPSAQPAAPAVVAENGQADEEADDLLARMRAL